MECRDESVRPDVTTSSAATRRWVPPSSFKRDAITIEEKYDEIFRAVRGILNKLTPEKFIKLSDELLNIGLDSALVLKGVIILIFEKALEEPKYSSLYSQLCRKLCDHSPDFGPPPNNSSGSVNSTFRSLLLKKCQDEFENRRKATEAFHQNGMPLSPDEEEQRSIAKHKMLGNITFIGELGKHGLLPEKIIHQCIQTLLAKKGCNGRPASIKDMAEDLECLCQIMKTVGRRLDTKKAKALMDQYFERIEAYASNQDLPSRIRFMLQDIVELRQNRWVPRFVHTDNSPKTIRQIHEEAAKDYGFYIPTMQTNANSMSELFSGEHVRLGLGRNKMSAMDDVFDPFILGGGNLGIGPGVITGDSFNGFSQGMGRNNRGYTPNLGNYIRQQTSSGGGASNGTQSNNNSQSQNYSSNYSNKSVPPRFKKAQLSSGRNPEEISLRPAQNSIMLKPKNQTQNNSLYPTSGRPTLVTKDGGGLGPVPVIGQPANTPMANQASVLIKQEKQKPIKSNMTKSELLKQLETLIPEYLKMETTAEEVVASLKDMKIPKKLYPTLLHHVMRSVAEKGDVDNHQPLLIQLNAESFVTSQYFIQAFEQFLGEMVNIEAEVPRIKSYSAAIASQAVEADIVTLEDICELLDAGAYYPLFLLFLQQLNKAKGKDWLNDAFSNSKVNLLNLMPEADKTNDRLLEVLEDRNLSFLLPLLRVQTDLRKKIIDETNPTLLYTWIKESVDVSLHSSPKFNDTLISCLIKHITEQTTLTKDVDRTIQPERTIIDKEKETLTKYKPIFQAFLHDHISLQVIALYALQVFCHHNSFPKGMLLRWFIMFYDFEIIEEEAFLKWKEDVNDEYPGKGNALFQVNQWLTWLEEAEEEDDEDEDDGSDND